MGGSENFGGDNLIFRKTKGEISRNCEPKKREITENFERIQRGGRGGGALKFAWIMKTWGVCGGGEGITSMK